MTTPPKVALVGRVNVGKSTLFNRLSEQKLALVSAEPGTTRDRRESELMWRGRRVILVDTGGIEATGPRSKKLPISNNQFPIIELQPLITEQTERALEEADLVLLVVSAEDGLMPQDHDWARRLRGKYPALLVVNKSDNTQRESTLSEFYDLGLGEPIPVSAMSGRRSGDLLDAVIKKLKRRPTTSAQTKTGAEKKPIPKTLNIAILGQPNSGKSSLLNAIIGEKRVVVSPMPHTTREPIDTLFTYNKQLLRLIDTAGIRRKAHVTHGVEADGVAASLGTLDRADVVILVIDIERGVTLQDQRLGQLIKERGSGLVIILNKWDLVPDKTAATMKGVEYAIRGHLPGLNWAPIIFVSAKTGQRVTSVLDAVLGAVTARRITMSEEALMDFLKHATKRHRPSRGGGVRHPSVLSFKQTGSEPTRFEVVTRGELNPSYLKFLENQLREQFGFVGTPIHIDLTTKRKKIVR